MPGREIGVAYYLSYPHVTRCLDEVATTELAFPAVITPCKGHQCSEAVPTQLPLTCCTWPPCWGWTKAMTWGCHSRPPGPEAFGEPFNLHRSLQSLLSPAGGHATYCSYCGGPCGPHNFSVVSGAQSAVFTRTVSVAIMLVTVLPPSSPGHPPVTCLRDPHLGAPGSAAGLHFQGCAPKPPAALQISSSVSSPFQNLPVIQQGTGLTDCVTEVSLQSGGQCLASGL